MLFFIELAIIEERVVKIMRSSIMKKSIIVAIILLILFGTLATLYINNLSDNLYSETDEYLNDLTNQTAKAIKNRINENLTQLTTISLIIQQDGILQEPLLDYLNQLAQRDGVKRFGIADLQGNVITSDHQTFNISDRDYFKDSLNGKTVTSKSITDYTDGEAINVYSVPIYKHNEVSGVLFATFYTDKLSSILSSATYNNVGYAFIFNENGDVVLSNKKTDDFNNIESLNGIDLNDIDINGKGIINFRDENNTLNYLIYANIEGNDWLVASVFPKEAVTGKFQNFIQTAYLTWLIIGVGSAVVVAYFYFIQGKNKLQITKLAYEDEITGHYNYYRFIEYCQNINHLSKYVLVNCDVKGFKWFNEIYGEEIANRLLKQIIICIDTQCQNEEFCCRQSADHFVILLDSDDFEQIKNRLFVLANYIRGEFAKEYNTSPYYFHFGVYKILEDDVDINLAFKKTQYTSNDLKRLSKDDVSFYQEEVFQKELYALQIEKEFQDSLKANHFKAYIQPKVNLQTGKVCSGEILTRWHHPEYNIISPGDFIPVYEKNGMLEALDFHIFKKALEQIDYWNKYYGIKISISVNVSRTYIFNEGYVDKLIRLVKACNVNPEQVEIEITETTALNHKEELIKILNQLKSYHFKVALDDFGSGYSSLNILKDLPIDVVKIDQEFFRTNDYTHTRSHIIIEEIIQLCHKLNLEVVAEGVETIEQKEFLEAHDCDYIQGYYYYRPMLLKEFEALFVLENINK